jgi:beta-glucanase (GH16 family)
MMAASATPTAPPQAAGYTLVFQDEFSPLSLSPNGEGNYTWYEGQWWETKLPPLSAISASTSGLTLNWKKGMAPELDLVTASHNGQYYHAWQYGYFEASLKWQSTTKGAWPGFWMLPIENVTGDASFGELDIMEGQGGAYPNTVFTTIHNWVNGVDTANNESSNAVQLSGVNLSQYHTYGVLWTPGRVTWYFDNQPINSASTYPIFDTQHFYLILTNQVGVNWTVGNTRGVTASDIQTNVQWVHVWQQP